MNRETPPPEGTMIDWVKLRQREVWHRPFENEGTLFMLLELRQKMAVQFSELGQWDNVNATEYMNYINGEIKKLLGL